MFGLNENEAVWRTVQEMADGNPYRAIADFYLSAPHLSHRGKGCAYAGHRGPCHRDAVRKAFEHGLRRTLALLSEKLATEPEEDTTAIRNLSRLVGAVILARAVDDPALAEDILRANQEPES
ncbi:hypothetical protein QO034_20315 [Sedimentitalea sp. JM2-8]|uniref:Uncharacterized protein n=1 Tax=Sedimentitalea xiamensis TaxID=3050037 RepID=A0ABT7FJW6_9RHOB|nr:hypothetical protein [Sedimentitalea xiamensis]MDK3075427.1 hypothetical protein [Sedimentitalea xiamensis]